MRIIHCPSCGSDDICKQTSRAEYSSSTTYSCSDCRWRYTKGSGMGTGSKSSGTHPRNAGPSSKQGTLTETGHWCSMCDTSAKPGYCRCVEDGQRGFCEECAKYSKYDIGDMWKVATYWGRHSSHKNPFPCSICEESKSEYKIVDSE